MATYFSILACRIPWREEPGRLQSTGLQRVGQNGKQLSIAQIIQCGNKVSGKSNDLMGLKRHTEDSV